jgi:predicted DNA-binding transcriptional regulator AlpA
MPIQLLNTSEVGKVLGVSRERVTQLASRDDFPEPFAVTMLGKRELRLWTLDSVLEWNDTADRSVGRPWK